MEKNWSGQEPIGKDWIKAGTITAHDCVWGVSIKPFLPTGWATFKVYAIGKAKRKANYWGTWNGERTARGKELGIMAEHRPDLLKKLEKLLKQYYP